LGKRTVDSLELVVADVEEAQVGKVGNGRELAQPVVRSMQRLDRGWQTAEVREIVPVAVDVARKEWSAARPTPKVGQDVQVDLDQLREELLEAGDAAREPALEIEFAEFLPVGDIRVDVGDDLDEPVADSVERALGQERCIPRVAAPAAVVERAAGGDRADREVAGKRRVLGLVVVLGRLRRDCRRPRGVARLVVAERRAALGRRLLGEACDARTR
jgi:hypothetical protein